MRSAIAKIKACSEITASVRIEQQFAEHWPIRERKAFISLRLRFHERIVPQSIHVNMPVNQLRHSVANAAAKFSLAVEQGMQAANGQVLDRDVGHSRRDRVRMTFTD
jgi:hypothetical protein